MIYSRTQHQSAIITHEFKQITLQNKDKEKVLHFKSDLNTLIKYQFNKNHYFFQV